MTLTITQSTNPQPNPQPNSTLPRDRVPQKSRPRCHWYTDANGKLVCQWSGSD